MGELSKESPDDHILTWLYKEEEDIETKKFPIEQYPKGFQKMKRHGYDGHSGLGVNKQGMLEPLQNPKLIGHQGLGFVLIKVTI